MSWLLENWFGSKESLEVVREEIHEHMQKEQYLGVSGIENPEQSQTRVSSSELFLTLHGPWEKELQEFEVELLQFIHDELPPVVRDEVGILPFFTNVLPDGYLVLTFIRNASDRDVIVNKLPLALVTPEGTVVARKTFDMLPFGPVGDHSSRPCEFFFRWSEFDFIPEKEVPLTLVYDAPARTKTVPQANQSELRDGLTEEEWNRYAKLAEEQPPITPGEVECKVLAVAPGEAGGLKVVVAFRNGLDKALEFTELPVLIRDRNGNEVARVNFGLRNLQVTPHGNRIWGFHVPADSFQKSGVDPNECTAYIPEAKQEGTPDAGKNGGGLVQ